MTPSPPSAPAAVPSPTRAVVAATIGNALEFYDFITYAFFALQIGRAFFPTSSAYGSLMLSLATFGAGFVTRPIGGLVIGAYSDRVGRKAGMMLSFVLMGVAVVAMALIPPYAQIGIAAPILAVLARLTMGFALGGEVGPTTAYLLECAPRAHRGLIVSLQGASQYVATTMGGLVGLGLASTLSPEALDAYGWRIAFALGAVTIPFGLWIRRTLPETLHLPEPKAVPTGAAAYAPAAPTMSRVAIARAHWGIFVVGLLIIASGTIRTYVVQFAPTFAQNSLGMSATPAFAVAAISGAVSIIGCLLGGALSDRLGRRPVVVVANIFCLLTTYPLFLWIVESRTPTALFTGIATLSFGGTVLIGAFYPALAELLPKNIRGAGFATAYAVAVAAFGGTCQLVVQWLIHETGNPMAPSWYLLAATAVGQIAVFFLPESAPVKVPLRDGSSG